MRESARCRCRQVRATRAEALLRRGAARASLRTFKMLSTNFRISRIQARLNTKDATAEHA